jgi:hypothetical protein
MVEVAERRSFFEAALQSSLRKRKKPAAIAADFFLTPES